MTSCEASQFRMAFARLMKFALADVLMGFDGNDFVNGNGGSDILYGYAGDDTIVGGAGGDGIDGGAGIDTASYSTATIGVTASLYSNSGNTNDAKGDTYYFIENLLGSRYNRPSGRKFGRQYS